MGLLRYALAGVVLIAFGCDSNSSQPRGDANPVTMPDGGTPDANTPTPADEDERPRPPRPDDEDEDEDEDEPGYPGEGDEADAGMPPGAPYAGPVFAEPTKGSAAALSPDGTVGLVANRDAHSVSVLRLDYTGSDSVPALSSPQELTLGATAEPWQVAIGPGGDVGYVIDRQGQSLIRINALGGTAKLGAKVAVHSEPTALALSPTGLRAYVANWNDGTVTVVDTSEMSIVRTLDLNPALAATGYLGDDVEPRAALAHPRALALTNDGDNEDADETLYVTEYFGQQVIAELPTGERADQLKVGIIYAVSLSNGEIKTIELQPLQDMGFADNNGDTAGCFPNQLQDIAIHEGYAYVVSVCASPRGPISFKTNTAPLISVIDLESGAEVNPGGQSLNRLFVDFYQAQGTPDDENRRLPLLANSLAFVPGKAVGYASAGGSDAVFRFEVGEGGTISAVGASTNPFINLGPSGQRPVGLVVSTGFPLNALVVSDVGHSAAVLDFNTQAIAGPPDDPRSILTAPLPMAGSEAEAIRRGKRFFTTGLARWSLLGQAWGACESCHSDGLTDNVTWYFPTGPRQSVAMDGTFASDDPADQRILNWTAVRDEIHDFELNTRNVSGGVGAGVSVVSTPPQNSDRIDLAAVGAVNLDGSAAAAMDPENPLGFDPPPQLNDWNEITAWVQTIRSPRSPHGLKADLIADGKRLFIEGGCAGCHGGSKWTVSQRFYEPSVEQNASLLVTPLVVPAGFPTALLPAEDEANQLLRFKNADLALDQIQCVNREVGTFNLAELDVGSAELRQDMTTKAQGQGDGRNGRGYNVPSLLGLSAGAPYFHNGGARSLEVLLSDIFRTHARALSPNLLTESDPAARRAAVTALTTYLLYIDETVPPFDLPAPGAQGGQLCGAVAN